MRPTRLFLALGLLLPAFAQAQSHVTAADAPAGAAPATAASAQAAVEFDRIVVTATRTERVVADVPNTVDVIDRERMDELLVRDLADLFRYEPGITAPDSAATASATSASAASAATACASRPTASRCRTPS